MGMRDHGIAKAHEYRGSRAVDPPHVVQRSLRTDKEPPGRSLEPSKGCKVCILDFHPAHISRHLLWMRRSRGASSIYKYIHAYIHILCTFSFEVYIESRKGPPFSSHHSSLKETNMLHQQPNPNLLCCLGFGISSGHARAWHRQGA